MGRKKRAQIKFKKLAKRKRKREKLKKAGKNPDQYFLSGIYIGEGFK